MGLATHSFLIGGEIMEKNMEKDIIIALSMIMETQRIMIDQLNSIVDVLSIREDVTVEELRFENGGDEIDT